MLYQNRIQTSQIDPAQLQGLLGMMYGGTPPQGQDTVPGNTAGAGLHNALGGLIPGIYGMFQNMVNQAKAGAAAQGYGG